MANNAFSKEEVVAFEKMLEGFEDGLVLSRAMTKFQNDQVLMARTNDTIWRPMPYIMTSYSGEDQTSNFSTVTQLSVPATVQYFENVVWTMSQSDLRDALQENRLGTSAYQKLASVVNSACNTVAANQGTIVVTSATTPTGYDDIATVETRLNTLGIPMDERYFAIAPKPWQATAKDLANRSTMNTLPVNAYERSLIPNVANMDLLRTDTFTNVTAAAGSGITLNGANQYYVPVATSTNTVNGGQSNVDNRYQTITVTATTGVAVGDAFTIAGVYEVHHITKATLDTLKTFRVISVVDGTHLKISPAIISAGGGSVAELMYQNVSATPIALAAITFINKATYAASPFWCKNALEIMPARVEVPTNAGMAVMRGTTDNGMELVFTKQADINTWNTKYRVGLRFGVNCVQPEMAGIFLWGQA